MAARIIAVFAVIAAEGTAPAQTGTRFEPAALRPAESQPLAKAPEFVGDAWSGSFLDLDAYVEHNGLATRSSFPHELWTWQLLPQGLIYRSYLGGTKEPRLAAHILNVRDQGGVFEGTLGTRVGLLRYGSLDPFWPDGWQIDAEGAAHIRMDLPDQVEVQAVDFRAGLPITYARGRYHTKFAYYHLSSHLGDEFLLKNPGFERLNYSRDVLVLGHSVYLQSNKLRLYAEAGWAFYGDVSEPWEIQFGIDYAPPGPTGAHGAPFWAINGHLREDVNFGGGLTVEAGWAWRGSRQSAMLRTGLLYYNGESNQFSFFDEHEEQIGFGLWYDS